MIPSAQTHYCLDRIKMIWKTLMPMTFIALLKNQISNLNQQHPVSVLQIKFILVSNPWWKGKTIFERYLELKLICFLKLNSNHLQFTVVMMKMTWQIEFNLRDKISSWPNHRIFWMKIHHWPQKNRFRLLFLNLNLSERLRKPNRFPLYHLYHQGKMLIWWRH